MNRNDIIQQIAREQLKIQTLETRSSDRLDFREIAVWRIASALDAAYSAGASEWLQAAEALLAAKDNQMETVNEWRALRRAVKHARKTR